jgi:Fur family ferric uptake transcriptional regulator
MPGQPNIYSVILEIFNNLNRPLSAIEITKLLLTQKLSPNKSTIYRAILKLESNGLISQIDFVDGTKRYELVDLNHQHHHLICEKCGKLVCLDLDDSLNEIILELEKQTRFKVKTGRVDFFGLCDRCKKL